MRRLPFKILPVAAALNAVLANNAVGDSALLINPDNSHSYLRYDTPKDWNTAKTACANLNGYLATIISQQEQDWVIANFGTGWTWLGGTDEGHEGTWTWVNGEAWTYTSWNPGQPDNGGGAEHFLHMWSDALGKWNDLPASYSIPYLCEWDNPVDLYNPNADFSATNGNPNGVWAYGWMPTDFSIFNFNDTNSVSSGLPGWSESSNTSNIWKNTGTGTAYGALPGQIALHPGNGTEPSVLRWTAPVDGRYRVIGQFFAGDSGSMLVGVRQDDTWLWQGTNAGAFDLNAVLYADDAIDFAVYGGYTYGNTPLDVNILLSKTAVLSIAKTGTGTGTVTSIPAGIDCGSTCTADFADSTEVALEAAAATGSTFDGWSDDSDPDCADGLVTTDANKTCTATFNLIPLLPPSAVTNAPSVITGNTAKLQGTVNPNGTQTAVTFECNGLPTVNGTPSPIAASASATAVSANLSGLACRTQYSCRIVATSSAGTTNGNYQPFTTATCTVATTRPATGIGPYIATLNGMVIPSVANTAVSFDFGPTTNYGTNVAATPSSISATAVVRGNKTELACNTTYNYRIKAVNSAGTITGANASFKTAPCPLKPELVVTNITISPVAPTTDGTFNAAIKVKNQGTAVANGIVVDVWANQANAQACGVMGDDLAYIETLAIGATTTVTITNLPAGKAGVKLLRAFVDSECGVNESNETNNQGTYFYAVNQPTGPDFVVTGVTLNPAAPAINGTFATTVTVKNQGTVAGDGKLLDVWSNQSTPQLCGAAGNKRVAIGALPAGASKNFTVTGLPAGVAGSKILRAFVDSGCSTGEKLEGNNQFTKAYIVNPASCLAIKTATPSAVSGTYTIDPDGATGAIAPFAVYCDMTTDGGGWTMVYKVTSGSSVSPSLLWKSATPQNENVAAALTTTPFTGGYVNRIVTNYWNTSGVNFNNVRLHLYSSGSIQKFLKFNAIGTTKTNWYSLAAYVTSSWTDIPTVGQNFFNIGGEENYYRTFFINRNYGGCEVDAGWVVGIMGSTCGWENRNKPAFIYSKETTVQNWTTGSIGVADVMAVFVR